jgi:hypothetical protein
MRGAKTRRTEKRGKNRKKKFRQIVRKSGENNKRSKTHQTEKTTKRIDGDLTGRECV